MNKKIKFNKKIYQLKKLSNKIKNSLFFKFYMQTDNDIEY